MAAWAAAPLAAQAEGGSITDGSTAGEIAAETHLRPADAVPDHRPNFEDRTSITWVLVPVSIRRLPDPSLRLDAEDFRLWVDDRPVEIATFDTGEDLPLQLVFLQDLSGSMANQGKMERSREALRRLAGELHAGDAMSLTTFASGSTRLEVPFTDQRARLEGRLDEREGWGTTALHDAVAQIPEISTSHIAVSGGAARRGIVLVTDGSDNASSLAPEEARKILHAAQIPVYVLDVGAGEEERASTGDALLLRRLADATGGRLYQAREHEQVIAACEEIARELRRQYVLGFPVAGGRDGDREREIRVEVDQKGLVFTHRRGYRGASPLPAS